MKQLFRTFIYHVFAIYIVNELFAGMNISGGVGMVLGAGILLAILMMVGKPILKILLLPINIITFGLAGLFINVLVLFLLTFLLPEVVITSFTFPGVSLAGFVIPSIHFSYAASLIVSSACITGITHTLYRLSEL